MRYELNDDEWAAIESMLPNKPRGVPRMNDSRVINGIFWVLRSGAPWRDLPDNFGRTQLATTASFAGDERVWVKINERTSRALMTPPCRWSTRLLSACTSTVFLMA